ncbi:MAG TPA: FAD-dependent oxidoreductase [Candidatus Babeliales bacterium]|nr:FAD-dependent oxidoreductase [Candidatus Babeliales bacterium]
MKKFVIVIVNLLCIALHIISAQEHTNQFKKVSENGKVYPVKLAIIGAGVAGLTAGIQAGRSKLKPLIIEGPNPGGGLSRANIIGNWAGELSISGYDLMEKLKKHATQSGCEFLSDEIAHTELDKNPFNLWTRDGNLIEAQSIIIATGTTQKKLGCTNEESFFGKGVAVCSMCDGPLYTDKEVIVIGGGNSAIYEALSLSKFTKKITIIDKNSSLSATPALQEKLKEKPFIKVILNTKVEEITGEDDRVTGVKVTDLKKNTSRYIPAAGIFVAIGMAPCSQPFSELNQDKNGYLIINNFTKTSINGIFAAGNIGNNYYKQAMAAAGTGCMAAIDAEKFLKDKSSDSQNKPLKSKKRVSLS